jgi:hypothetical protein
VTVARSVPAWLLLGLGRLMASPGFLPVAYLLFNPWNCGFSNVSTDLYFITPDCGAFFQCFSFWHWVLVVLSAVLLVLMFYTVVQSIVPLVFALGFGLPLFMLVTVPLRLVMAWSARILITFSVCGSVLVSLLCNIAMLGLVAIALSCGLVNLSPLLAVVLVVVQLWCVIAGCAAAAVYYTHQPDDAAGCKSCNDGLWVFIAALLLLLVALVWLWRLARKARTSLVHPDTVNTATSVDASNTNKAASVDDVETVSTGNDFSAVVPAVARDTRVVPHTAAFRAAGAHDGSSEEKHDDAGDEDEEDMDLSGDIADADDAVRGALKDVNRLLAAEEGVPSHNLAPMPRHHSINNDHDNTVGVNADVNVNINDDNNSMDLSQDMQDGERAADAVEDSAEQVAESLADGHGRTSARSSSRFSTGSARSVTLMQQRKSSVRSSVSEALNVHEAPLFGTVPANASNTDDRSALSPMSWSVPKAAHGATLPPVSWRLGEQSSTVQTHVTKTLTVVHAQQRRSVVHADALEEESLE